MAAYLVITLTTIDARTDLPNDAELDRLSLPETAHLDRWRRRKNKAAKQSHYRRRDQPEP